MNNVEKEVMLIEAEEFFYGTSYESDLSDERNARRAKVRNKRRTERAVKRSNATEFNENSLLFRISKKITALESKLQQAEADAEMDKIFEKLLFLRAARENILAASDNSRKLRKLLIKYKDVA